MWCKVLALFLLGALTAVQAAPSPDEGLSASLDVSVDVSGDIGLSESIEAEISGSDSSIYAGPIEWDDNCDCRLEDNDYYDDILYITRRYQDFLAVRDFQEYSEREVDSTRKHFYNHGSDNETTLFENENAFQRLRLRPRILRGVGVRDTTTQMLGDDVSFPLGLGLDGNNFLEYVDPDGEIGVAEAAECEGVPYIVSAFSNTDLEEIARRAPHANLWMETHIFFDRSITEGIIERAEAAGYRAIVVTVNTPVAPNLVLSSHDHFVLPEYLHVPNIENDLSNEGFDNLFAAAENEIEALEPNANYFRRHHVLANIELVKGKGYFKTQKVDQKFERYERCIGSFLYSEFFNYLVNPEASWEDLRWITTLTDLPIVVRGILTGCDAVRAVENGVSAIIVSNNGGRTVDTAPATIEALAEVLEAVDVYQNVEVYVEGGVRWGTDIFKALAMGADAVFIGRPVTWGMFHSGKCGVRRVVQLLRSEFDRDMAFMGTKHVQEITSTMVVSQNYYSNRYKPDDVDARLTAREDALECPFGYDYDEGYQPSLEDVNDLNLIKRSGKYHKYL